MHFTADQYIVFDNSTFESLNSFLSDSDHDKLFILVDEKTRKHCLPKLAEIPAISLACTIEIKSGEEHKTLQTCEYIWNDLTANNASRNSLLINLGGGVIGDMGGFAASCYKRGMRFINIPTTLLAIVDASVGGKLGVDFNGLKNHIGMFNHPEKVIIQSCFFESLPERQLRSGFAEVIKHALIADSNLWTYLQGIDDLTQVNWDEIIPRSVEIKSEIVAQDPTEKGLRKVLNFGHTIGHAIESMFLNTEKPLLHGEAVAIGMICEAFLSENIGILSVSKSEEIMRYIRKIFADISINIDNFDVFFDYLKQDKKNKAEKYQFSLISDIGKAVFDHSVGNDLIEECMKNYQELIKA
ncbi:MAG: 3-dehydroquinate synthase [Bacteroidetes bacterium]|nr:3-dehydroquinate synthase [Bacteroidota bacterium]